MQNPYRTRQVAELKKLKAALAANREAVVAELERRKEAAR